MKILFISDIHGVPSTLKAALAKAEALGFDVLALLGDLMYHGPRNGVPALYDPVEVARTLNSYKSKIIAVRGNCDAEVDQMMLEFPITDDYRILDADGKRFFLTHGHIYNETRIPPEGMASALIHGHTHVHCAIPQEDYVYINPGSAALPKEGQAPSYMIYEDGVFTVKHLLTGEVLLRWEMTK